MDSLLGWLFLLAPVAVAVGVVGFFIRETGILQTLLALAVLVFVVSASFFYAKSTTALGWSPSTSGGVFAVAFFVGSYVIWRIASR